MSQFMRKPVVAWADQWWPPDDARHDAKHTPVRWPNVGALDDFGCECADQRDCLDPEHRVADGDIGYDEPGRYWLRQNNSSARWLVAGDWIVRGEQWPGGIQVIPAATFEAVYDPVQPDLRPVVGPIPAESIPY